MCLMFIFNFKIHFKKNSIAVYELIKCKSFFYENIQINFVLIHNNIISQLNVKKVACVWTSAFIFYTNFKLLLH